VRAPGGLVLALACVLVSAACEYVVVPPEEGGGGSDTSKGWSAVATSVGPSDDGLRIELTIRNETGDWSAMEAADGKPPILSAGSGGTTSCATVFVGTGGHRLAPGLQMRGFVGGTKTEPTIEPIRVECAGAEAVPGSKLAIDYRYVTGEYNYYDPDANQATGRLEVDLDAVAADLTYPIAEPIEGLVQQRDVEITAINDVLLSLTGAERTSDGVQLAWRTKNPGAYPTFVHIGIPPVIGSDGILYGRYESPDLESVPVTPAGEEMEWATEVAVPNEVAGLFIMLSVESKKQRLFVNYAIDLTDT
jgi:hypothetical protein